MRQAIFDELFAEIDSLQKEIDSLQGLSQKHTKEYYRIGLTYNSNAIEGNSLTEIETKIVLEDGIAIGGKRLIDHLEAVGHSDAMAFMYQCAQKKDVTEDDIKKLHCLFYSRIDLQNAGNYRKLKTHITGSQYPLPDPETLSDLMKELIEFLHVTRIQKHPVELAAFAHKEFVFIHPFIDGNGRVSRLLMNLLLLQSGYNIAIIPFILRHEYYAVLEKAHTDDTDFIIFIARAVKETQKDYLRLFS